MSSGRHLFRVAITIVVGTVHVLILIKVTEVVGSSTVSYFLLFLLQREARWPAGLRPVRNGDRTGPYGVVRTRSVRVSTRTDCPTRTEWRPYGPVRTGSVLSCLAPYGGRNRTECNISRPSGLPFPPNSQFGKVGKAGPAWLGPSRPHTPILSYWLSCDLS